MISRAMFSISRYLHVESYTSGSRLASPSYEAENMKVRRAIPGYRWAIGRPPAARRTVPTSASLLGSSLKTCGVRPGR
jgi:hypothetical protein